MTDPFKSLDPEWARDAERRAVRDDRARRLRRGFRPSRPAGRARLGPTAKLLLIGAVAALAVVLSFGASFILPSGR
ncbi:hypothetical protein ACPPVO_12850 [Dactylosporangium sp. McL0621]|uniref:hypothetical protein n=1 Tax=Dactylosporangium sp. McL0621 TaxID=3415678 RepID=UPI003CFA62C3